MSISNAHQTSLVWSHWYCTLQIKINPERKTFLSHLHLACTNITHPPTQLFLSLFFLLSSLLLSSSHSLTWHGGQFSGHVPLGGDLLPGARGKVVSPKLTEERVVVILRAARLIVIRVISAKDVQVALVCHAAVAASGGRCAMACGDSGIWPC